MVKKVFSLENSNWCGGGGGDVHCSSSNSAWIEISPFFRSRGGNTRRRRRRRRVHPSKNTRKLVKTDKGTDNFLNVYSSEFYKQPIRWLCISKIKTSILLISEIPNRPTPWRWLRTNAWFTVPLAGKWKCPSLIQYIDSSKVDITLHDVGSKGKRSDVKFPSLNKLFNSEVKYYKLRCWRRCEKKK